MKKTIIALIACEFALQFITTDDNIWYVNDVSDSLRIIALCVLIASTTRNRVSAWCLVVAYGACEALEATSNIAWYWFDLYNPLLDTMRAVTALAVLAYYFYRRYDVTPINNTIPSRMYITYHRPTTRQDRILAMFGTPLGGVGLYSRGLWYHYHHGRFIISECKPTINHVMIKSVKYNGNVIKRLEELEGTRWGILNNCITEVITVVRLGRRIRWIPKPRS